MLAPVQQSTDGNGVGDSTSAAANALRSGAVTVLPDDGRALYFAAIDAARQQIRIEICVLEDPMILEHLQAALERSVEVRVIVDRGKYGSLTDEEHNLGQYLTSAGGQLHLSNPVFPRSFPKIILIDSRFFIFGSACLDETTFAQYRDFGIVGRNRQTLRRLQMLFANDWTYSSAPGDPPPPFNPTPPIAKGNLIVSPVNASEQLVRLYQSAKRTLDVYTELLGNLALEGELAAAVQRGVKVRLIAPQEVNGGGKDINQLQLDSLTALAAAGVDVHVSGPNQTFNLPYMHARAAVVDSKIAYLGSISLAPDSTTVDREMGMVLRRAATVRELKAQFDADFSQRTRKF
jgi:phosphatidylserine/phosphatidylglycerophosphate/cardiolipin synthase-like enzyme